MTLLTAAGVKKTFGGVIALSNGNLTCEAGKITGLLGTNGSGKSTISKIITGIYEKDEGSICFEGKEIQFKTPYEAKKNGISMVFQNLSLIPDLTVWENVVLGVEKTKRGFLDNESAITLVKSIMDDLEPDMDIARKVSQLNPAQQQITEIAKAICTEPKLLILDEPTAALEQKEVHNLFHYMRKLAKRGVGMIFTSHRLWEVLEICDNVVVFRNGENVGGMDFSKDERNIDAMVQIITGESKAIEIHKGHHELSDDVIFEVNHMHYGKYIRDVSLHLKKGEVLGIGGLAGQGQTELMLALGGNYPETAADVMINGKKTKLNKPQNAVQNGILLVPGDRQKEGSFQNNSIYFNMVYPKLGLKHQPLFTPEKKYRKEAWDIFEKLSVRAPNIDSKISTLSGGNQQKIVVGKWLPFDIHVLLLADPAKGVDVAAKRDLYDFVIRLVKEKNMSVILYASDNEELIHYCDRLLIMYEGKIAEELTGTDINDENITAKSVTAGCQEE